MTSLFDLPFEDDADPAPKPRPTPAPAAAAAPAPDTEPAPEPTPQRRIYSVRQLTAALRGRIEEAFPRIWVEGELAECRRWQSGHVYFTLKDDDAQLQGVMFRTEAARLRFAPAAGLHVLVRGRLSVYPQKGQYQLVADAMEPRGAGALQVAFEQIKRRLQAEGLFDVARKRPLPMLPRRVGLVTSPDGAALRDVVRVLRTRHAPVDLVISPARVQGEGAAAELARALRRVTSIDGVDVVIIGRGGGAAEDLWAFNDEHLARTIAACPVPVVSAVGHEIDTTIADFVADVRAATPSQAAELVARQATEFQAQLRATTRHLVQAARGAVERRRLALLQPRTQLAFAHVRDGVAARDRARLEATLALVQQVRAAAGGRRERLRALDVRLTAQHPRARLAAQLRRLVAADGALLEAGRASARTSTAALRQADARLAAGSPAARVVAGRRDADLARHRLVAAMEGRRHRAGVRAGALAGRLENLSPLRTLARGYAACWDASHQRLIRSVAETAAGATVHVQVSDGELQCQVGAVHPARRDA